MLAPFCTVCKGFSGRLPIWPSMKRVCYTSDMSARPPHATSGSSPRPTPPKKGGKAGWIVLLAAGMLVSFGAGAVTCLGMRQSGLLPEDAPPVQSLAELPGTIAAATLSRTNVLLLGSDVGYTGRRRDSEAPVRSDTIIVASLDPKNGQVNLLSIPRDTRVEIPGRQGFDKINAAFAFGGADLTRETVAQFLGVPIDHYVRLKLDGLMQIVDVLGGIDVEVEKNMRYRDRAGGLKISLKKGLQTLNGQQAQEYVRFRHDENGDIGRVQRQQVFIKAVVAKLLEPATILKLPAIIEVVQQNIETDFTTDEILRYATWAKGLHAEAIHAEMVPGAFSGNKFPVSYWLPDAEATRHLASRLLTDVMATGMPPADPAQPDVPAVTVDPTIKAGARITILNGTARTGLASEAARVLRQEGWTVWVVGNAPRKDVAATEFAVSHGDGALVRPLAQTLGVSGAFSRAAGDPSTDYTITLGEDFAEALRQERLPALGSAAPTGPQQ